MGKGEIARYEHFLLFPRCFQKACFQGRQKVLLCGNGLNSKKTCFPHFDKILIIQPIAEVYGEGNEWQLCKEIEITSVVKGALMVKLRQILCSTFCSSHWLLSIWTYITLFNKEFLWNCYRNGWKLFEKRKKMLHMSLFSSSHNVLTFYKTSPCF